MLTALKAPGSPAGLGSAGTDGVCGLLADGYHYSLDTWGQAQADTRLRA